MFGIIRAILGVGRGRAGMKANCVLDAGLFAWNCDLGRFIAISMDGFRAVSSGILNGFDL